MDDEEAVFVDGRPPWYLFAGDRSQLHQRRLALEAQVMVTPGAQVDTLNSQHHEITVLCESWLSVAEIAHYLQAPVDVARVLIEQLVDRGVLTVGNQVYADRPSLATLRLVRDRLQML